MESLFSKDSKEEDSFKKCKPSIKKIYPKIQFGITRKREANSKN